jgi:NAD+ synthase
MSVTNDDIDAVTRWIRNYLGDKKAVVGISGGIDSAVVAHLCTLAVGRNNVFGVKIPIESSKDSSVDATAVINNTGIIWEQVNLTDAYEELLDALDPKTPLARGNIKARLRMIALYDMASCHKALVVGTTNKTESLIGYCTKFGDHGVDIEPIQDFYKTEIFEMARLLGVPEQIINKKPTADLWEGQTDEDEIGLTYARIDEILMSRETTAWPKTEELPPDFQKVKKMIDASEHKRNVPPSYLRY